MSNVSDVMKKKYALYLEIVKTQQKKAPANITGGSAVLVYATGKKAGGGYPNILANNDVWVLLR